MSILIQNGRLLDPISKTDKVVDILIEAGLVSEIAAAGSLTPSAAEEIIDAKGKWVTPGFVDMHACLREPGYEYKEDLESGGRAAVAGGFTTVVTMPNTKPVVDNAEQVRYVRERSREVGLCDFVPTGALTVGRAGKNLAPLAEMQKAGAVAFTDGGHSIENAQLMRNALEYSTDFGMTVLSHAEDRSLSMKGQINEGVVSTRLGLLGMPTVAEESIVARDSMLAEYAGAKLHFCHLSTAGSIKMVADAQERGASISAEVAAHHLVLSEDDVSNFDTSAKVNPPLRTDSDRLALVEGVRNGVIGAITSDHTPQSVLEKDLTFARAEFGAIGLQTVLPAVVKLIDEHNVAPLTAIGCLTSGPAAILGLSAGVVAKGSAADIAIIDPEELWEFTKELNASKCCNSPFLGKSLKGRVLKTIAKGKVVFTV